MSANDVVAQLRAQAERLRDERSAHEGEIADIDVEIARVDAAIAALLGEVPQRLHNKRSRTAAIAILAAHGTFNGEPVHTSRLLDHPDLVHYSRHTLRSALAELHRGGQLMPVERTPKGFIW